jgi:uncharacterized protein
MPTLDEVLAAYDWYDHPEGIKFVETDRDPARTSGHFLYLPGTSSVFHRVVDNAELWYIHHGSLLLHVLEPGGALTTHRLGSDVAGGERPSHVVPVGIWQAAELPHETPWAFGSVVCAPPFSFEHSYQEAERGPLLAGWPEHASLIRRLTPSQGR